jgi:hypothetical protein
MQFICISKLATRKGYPDKNALSLTATFIPLLSQRS